MEVCFEGRDTVVLILTASTCELIWGRDVSELHQLRVAFFQFPGVNSFPSMLFPQPCCGQYLLQERRAGSLYLQEIEYPKRLYL